MATVSRRTSPLIAIVCALFLLGAQQFAFAHWIGHIGAATSAVSVHGSSDGDESAHSCETCVALTALTAAPPAFVAPIDVVPAAAIPFSDLPLTAVPARSASPYGARAPPAIL
jgi:hypothetical protein